MSGGLLCLTTGLSHESWDEGSLYKDWNSKSTHFHILLSFRDSSKQQFLISCTRKTIQFCQSFCVISCQPFVNNEQNTETNIWRAQGTWKQIFHRKYTVTITTYRTISIHSICGKVNSSKKFFKTDRNLTICDIVDQTYHWKNWELQPALIKL